MDAPTQEVTIYVGKWNQNEYVYALSNEEAKRSVSEHFAFGDPFESPYAVGSKWATRNDDSGWRIVRRKAVVAIIDVEVKIGNSGSTGHVSWKCPYCFRPYSDDWGSDDNLPVLLMCGCDNQSRFFIGVQRAD